MLPLDISFSTLPLSVCAAVLDEEVLPMRVASVESGARVTAR